MSQIYTCTDTLNNGLTNKNITRVEKGILQKLLSVYGCRLIYKFILKYEFRLGHYIKSL